MASISRFLSLTLIGVLAAAAPSLHAAEQTRLTHPKFTGLQSCQSSGCHGGGTGKDQTVIWSKKDFHRGAHTILATARSTQIAEGLNIQDATKSARCTVCHSPLQAVPKERFAAGVKPDAGVSCESCHGPAEPWLRFHTRPDVTHEQRVAAGLRELGDFYSRSNSCIACHLNIDADLVRAGHPEMFFELDGQQKAQPPHWKDEGTWLGPQAWITGQAAALRELSWKLVSKPADDLAARWRALGWLLRKANVGSLPETEDFSAMQVAADKLARNAARAPWSKEKTNQLFRTYAGLANDFRDAKLDAVELRRRAEVLVIGIERLWAALKAEGGFQDANVDTALMVANGEARAQLSFDSAKFAAALEQVEVAIERMPKN